MDDKPEKLQILVNSKASGGKLPKYINFSKDQVALGIPELTLNGLKNIGIHGSIKTREHGYLYIEMSDEDAFMLECKKDNDGLINIFL